MKYFWKMHTQVLNFAAKKTYIWMTLNWLDRARLPGSSLYAKLSSAKQILALASYLSRTVPLICFFLNHVSVPNQILTITAIL